MPALVPQLIDAAQRILSLSLAPGQNAEPLSRNWISRYLKKYLHMRRVRQETRKIDRSASEEIAVYERHFRDFQREVEEKGILLGDIYNMDETGFRIGVGGSQWVVTMDMNRPQFSPSDTNRDYATSIEAVSGDGVVIDPMLIMKGVNHLEKWYAQTSLPDNYFIGIYDSGYTNDTLSIKCIKNFDRCTSGRTLGAWRLLIFDGYGSHCTKEIIDYCDDNKIVPFSLPPHSSQHLQPLDVVIFQPSKHYHKQAVEASTRTGCTNFNKVEFLNAIHSIRSQTFKHSTIVSGWRKSGLIPLNPEMAIQNIRPSTPEWPRTPPAQVLQQPKTPTTARAISQMAAEVYLDSMMHEGRCNQEQIRQLCQSTIINATLRQRAEEELQALTAAASARNQRQQPSRRVVQKGGVIYAYKAREAVDKRLEKEAEAVGKAAARKHIATAKETKEGPPQVSGSQT